MILMMMMMMMMTMMNIAAAGAVDRELIYIELGDLSPPHQQQQQHQRTTATINNNNNNINSGMFVCRNGMWGRTGGRARARAGGRVRAGALLYFSLFFCIFLLLWLSCFGRPAK